MRLVYEECTQLRMNSDLNLSLEPSNNLHQESLNAESGVGANAAYVGGDHLAELVWSPRNGLSIKSSAGILSEKKTSMYWEAELREMINSPTYGIATENYIDNVAHEREFLRLHTVSPVEKDLAITPALFTSLKGDAMNMQMCQLDIGHDSGFSENMVVMTSLAKDNGKICPLSPIKDNLLQEVQDLRKFKITSKDPIGSNTEQMEDGPNEMMDTVSARAHSLEKLETETGFMLQSPSHSDIGIRNRLRGGKEQFSPVRSFTSKRKGKEIVDSDSYESVDCNTSRLVGARKRLAEHIMGVPKRVKLHIQETPNFTSFTRSDGSFVNWISTLAKGLSRPVENGVPFLGDAGNGTEKKALIICRNGQDHKSGKMGFQSLFGSLHQPKQKMQDQTFLSSDDPHANEGYKEFEAVEKSNEKNGSSNTKPCSKDDLVASEQKMVSNESQNQCAVLEEQDPWIPSDCKTSALPKSYMSAQDSAESAKEHNRLSHSWLSHFCPNSSGLILSSVNRIQGADLTRLDTELRKSHISPDAEADCAMKRIEGKNVNPILHSNRFESSEAMASIFAKRMDAIKQIVQTNLVDKATPSTITCFFCGIVGHDLRDCPQVTDTEVDKLLDEMTTYSGAEESCCFCIKCFQLNHWAVACPNAPVVNKSEVEHGVSVLHHPGLGQKLHFELPDGIDGQPLDITLDIGATLASNLEKVDADENASRASASSYPCKSIGKQELNKSRRIFEVVRSLQLSRIDVLKFIYSKVSISNLDGYYLRLRRKPEEGIGGSGYQVACISGMHGEESIDTSKKVISVFVGGHRCSIESQCISNQDFLEDELMDWRSLMISGGGKIPSEDEFMIKVEERRRLGL